jgi:2-polyprenyl-3-methyl-5-hydroxy-6-metoxy-1,4-benzoquinol methylase
LNIEFERVTIFDEKFKEGSFDAVIAFNVFHLLDEPQKYIQRINRLLKPGGLILSATPCMREAPFLNLVLKFFSFIGISPKLNSFTSHELKNLLVNQLFKTLELIRIKPKLPQ